MRWQELEALELREPGFDLLVDEIAGLAGDELVGGVPAGDGPNRRERAEQEAAEQRPPARADAPGLVAQLAAEVDLAQERELGVELPLVDDGDQDDARDREGVDAAQLEFEAQGVVAQLELGLAQAGVRAHVLVGAQDREELALEHAHEQIFDQRRRGAQAGDAGLGLGGVAAPAELADEHGVGDPLASPTTAGEAELDEVPARLGAELREGQAQLARVRVTAGFAGHAVDRQDHAPPLGRRRHVPAPLHRVCGHVGERV